MNEGKLKQILYELQEQNKDLLNMVMILQVSNNLLKQQFIVEEMNDMTSKETQKIVMKFEENLECMEENLEKIVT